MIFSNHSPPSELHRSRYQTFLLLLTALVIFLTGSARFSAVGDNYDSGPTIGTMIASIGDNEECGIDSRQAVFLFEPIDLNRADRLTLTSLKGIGPKIAGRIVDYRQANGNYSDPDALLDVRGIGEKKLARIRADLTVSNCPD